MSLFDWEVRIADNWPANRHRMVVRRMRGGEVEYLGPDGVASSVYEGTAAPEERIWDLPAGTLESMRDEIDRLLGRRYDEQLVAELRASLEAERARVDGLLSAAVARVAAS